MSHFADTPVAANILTIVIFLPILGAGVLLLRTGWEAAACRKFAAWMSVLTLVATLAAAYLYFETPATDGGAEAGGLRLVERHTWMELRDDAGVQSAVNLRIQYYLGIDGISLPLLLLTAFLTPLVIWGSFTAIADRAREYYSLLLLLHGAMLGVFCARDLLLFYVFFEFTLIPLYFLIGIWGGSQRQKAANTFFIYTLTGSMLTFAGVMYLGWQASLYSLGTPAEQVFSFDMDRLYQLAADGHLSQAAQFWLFLAFFAGFAIKVPLFPLHTWLPLAHTEAPTAGSVILAGVLLKLGTYGFLRLSLPMVPDAAMRLGPFIGWLAVVGIIYGAVAAWVQSDFKKLVAYSSVSHLGYCLLGMFSTKMAGLQGSLLYMVNHGLSTGALFLIVGMIYERYHTREMAEVGGLAKKMPIMAFFLIVFTLSSIGLPGLNGFVGEFLVLLGTFTSHDVEDGSFAGPLGIEFAVGAAAGIILGAVYMLHLVRQILFGPLREPHGGPDLSKGLAADLTRREVAILTPIAIACVWLGVYPKSTMEVMRPSLQSQVLARVEAAATEPGRLAGVDLQSHAPPGGFLRPSGAYAPRASHPRVPLRSNRGYSPLPLWGKDVGITASRQDARELAPDDPAMNGWATLKSLRDGSAKRSSKTSAEDTRW